MTTGAPVHYDPAPESRAVADLRPRYQLFLDGAFADGTGGEVTTVDPSTGEPLSAVCTAGEQDVEAAVRAARRAQDRVWSKMPGAERGKYLFRIARMVQERSAELAVLEAMDSGRPVRECRDGDLPGVAAQFFHHAGWADKLAHAGWGPGPDGSGPRPLGVAAQVVSADTPLLAAARKIAPALATGSTVVLKPSGSTPLTALVLAEICQQADLPPGVLAVLPGGDAVGHALVTRPGVDAVSFTGSFAVGQQVQRDTAGTGRRLTLVLAGPGSAVVLDDAPLEQAVDGLVAGAAQGCCATTRLIVQESVVEEVLERLRARTAALRTGDPLDVNTDVGPFASAERLARTTDLLAAGEAEGAHRWSAPEALPDAGFFLAPTVLAEVQPTMRVAREEVPGPVLSVLTFRTTDEALALATTPRGGSRAAIWTAQASRAFGLAARLRVGVVWAGTAPRHDPAAAAGGCSGSGGGREGGAAGLEGYLDV